MNYIDLLTKEEKLTLCEIIGGKAFKELFRKYENDFSKIKKGFRAISLSEQQALSVAKANIDKPFIATYVNAMAEYWLPEIQENIEKLEDRGETHNAALAATLPDSFFADHVELYFKLAGETPDADAYADLCERMESIRSEHEKNDEEADRIRALEEENHRLSGQVEAGQRQIRAMKEECDQRIREIEREKNDKEADRIRVLEEENHRLSGQVETGQRQIRDMEKERDQRIREIEQEKSDLANRLAGLQEQIAALQSVSSYSRADADDSDSFTAFDDTVASALPHAGSDEIVSLCRVESGYNGQKRLVRCADLYYNGYYHIFQKNEDLPPYFTNRDWIYYKDGPSDVGFYGIWTWSAVPNERDPSRDYIRSRYNTEIDSIEIVIAAGASNLDELISLLKKGIEYQPHSNKIMFSIHESGGGYIGILCNMKKLAAKDGKIAFAEDCTAVPVYKFAGGDIMRVDNSFYFYRNAFAGNTNTLYFLKTPLEIVKDIVCSSISWTAYKAMGATRNAYRGFKDFLNAVPTDDITRQIETACRCSAAAAEKLLNEFLAVAWEYLDAESLEDEIIRTAVSASTELQERTKALIRADWEEENGALLTEAQEELDSLRAAADAAAAELAEAQELFNRTKAEEERLNSTMAEKEKLAADVEKAVADRIQRAREHAAEFIADMAFAGMQPMQTEAAVVPVTAAIPPASAASPYYTVPVPADLTDLDVHHSWADVIETAAIELQEAGVAGKYAGGLAAFLCAAYIEKQPLFLAGPAAIDIVQAFSAATAGHKHGVLCCSGSYNDQIIREIGADGEDIVMINNLLTGGWINRLPEILSDKDIFYIATHPYAEDLQVEPGSLYGFMLPLFTEFFVEKKAAGRYLGGYRAGDFKPYAAQKAARRDLKALSEFGLSPFVRNRINRLVTVMHDLRPETTADDMFLSAVLPIAYASMNMNKLAEAIADSQKGITISADLKRDLQHVLGEV